MSWRRLAHGLLLLPIRAAVLLFGRRLRRQRVERSLWLGDPVLTLASNARAESTLGIEADSLVFRTYYTSSDFTYDLGRWTRVPLLGKTVRYGTLLWALFRYQRFHFFYNRGFLPQLERGRFNVDELELLRSAGKQLFFWAFGGDVRARGATEQLGRWNCCLHCPSPGNICVCDDELSRTNVETIERFATATFSMGDMLHYTPGSRNDLFYWPLDLAADGGAKYRAVLASSDSSAPLVVAHAANEPAFKGTRYLERAIEELQSEGVAIELRRLRRVSNVEVLDAFRQADVVFDQVLIGFHGYTALEAMALGKAVLCYLRHPERYLLEPHECPIVNVDPETLKETLSELAADRQRVRQLGVRGRRYIEAHFTLEAFARRLQRALP